MFYRLGAWFLQLQRKEEQKDKTHTKQTNARETPKTAPSFKSETYNDQNTKSNTERKTKRRRRLSNINLSKSIFALDVILNKMLKLGLYLITKNSIHQRSQGRNRSKEFCCLELW